jgi:hypothetical protein
MRPTAATRASIVILSVLAAVFARAPAHAQSAPTAASGSEAAPETRSETIVAHEWGTFTSLQNELGKELGGINVDDEPVPEFVHNLSRFLLVPTFLTEASWIYRMKQVPRQHPHVTMRLETPVIYFYRPDGDGSPLTLDVDVRFRGGWISEFYPNGEADAPGLRDPDFDFGDLRPDGIGRVTWRGLRVGTENAWPETEEHVWVTPRRVKALGVTTALGESERYLFYRGVGRVPSPLRVISDREKQEIEIRGNSIDLDAALPFEVPLLWLVDVRTDGALAFREINGGALDPHGARTFARASWVFEPKDYAKENLDRLWKAMHGVLVSQGLYDDEATAMLSTWKRAYYTSPGRRLFFPVPRAWVDHRLPLEISAQAKIERVFVGRIELVTERHEDILRELAKTVPDGEWIRRMPRNDATERFFAGRTDFGDLGVPIPRDYQLYLDLGRFRSALIAEEERRRPSDMISRFIDTYGLKSYRWGGDREAVETASKDARGAAENGEARSAATAAATGTSGAATESSTEAGPPPSPGSGG